MILPGSFNFTRGVLMTHIEKMQKKYPGPNAELEQKIKSIEAMDISNVQQLELIQKAEAEATQKNFVNDINDWEVIGFYPFYENARLGLDYLWKWNRPLSP